MANGILENGSGFRLDMINCVFCNEEQNRELKLLNCIHSSCVRCLTDHPGSVQCPKCHQVTEYNHLADLPDNFLQGPTSAIRAVSEPKPCTMCQVMGKTTVSTVICFECRGETMCGDCVKVHQAMLATRSHKPLAITDLLGGRDVLQGLRQLNDAAPCSEHPKEPLSFYCYACKSIVCRDCVDEQHSGHKRSTLVKISEGNANNLNERLSPISKDVSDIKARIRALEKHLHAMKAEEQDLIDKISKRTIELIGLVRQRGQSHIHDARSIYGRYYDRVKTQLTDLTCAMHQGEDTKSFVEVYNILPDVDIVKQHDFMLKRLSELQDYLHEVNVPFVRDDAMSLYVPPPAVAGQRISGAFGSLTPRGIEKAVEQANRGEMRGIKRLNTAQTQVISFIYGLDITNNSDILVVGDRGLIEMFTPGGDSRCTIELKGNGVWDVQVWQNEIYLSDKSTRQIVELDKYGQVQRVIELPRIEQEYRGHNGFSVALNSVGDVYIASHAANALYYCARDSDKAILYRDLRKDKLALPWYICFTPRDELVMSHYVNQAVSVRTLPDDIHHVHGKLGAGGATGGGQLNSPRGVCCDRMGNIYVADNGNHRVSVLSPKGHLISHLVTHRQHGIQRPQCVAISPDGNLLAVGHDTNKLSIFSAI